VSQRFNESAFRQQMRAAQRKAEQELKRAVDKANREAAAHNRKVIADYNRKVDQHIDGLSLTTIAKSTHITGLLTGTMRES
jgi:hypothetical protein